MKTRICARCGEETPISDLVRKTGKAAGLLVSPMLCKPCRAARARDYYHLVGNSMDANRQCASFLGVYVAERVLAAYFKTVTKMPYGNPGFDFVCGRGYKIDVKSACLRHVQNHDQWGFTIRKNTIADYFVCIGFDDRESLNPLRTWMIPGNVINHRFDICITNSPLSIAKWSDYEHPIEQVIECCDHLKNL